MCAIAGMISLASCEDTNAKMLKTMARRGPDASGVYQRGDATLLHSRLAIIDPAGGMQPMELSFDGEHYILVYNGELYNTQEVREELERAGHTFTGHSDTEVVLHAFAQWGKACLEKFNGIFAFAVWEENRKRLFFARDRIGVKPLFYMLHRGGLLFASEIKTILCYPTVKAQLDPQGAAELLLLGPGRTPGCGIFYGMQELEAGCCAYFERGNLRISRYWKLTDREHTESFADTVEHVRYLVLDAITRQMVSDVPVGTFLSGGLDSSLISAVCARVMEERNQQLQTFSVDYVDHEKYFQPGKFQPNSDTYYIKRMQQEIHSDHHWSVLSPDELLAALEDATIARDLPGMADVDFSLLVFCRSIRDHVKVALSGECADEIFGGYPWYRDPQIRALNGFPWSQNAQQRSDLLCSTVHAKIEPLDYIRDRYRDTCAASDILPGTPATERRMKEMVNLNFNWFMQTLLDRKDRMSMYNGLEVRVPFCDYRIAQYLYGVPWDYKDHQGKEKGLLRIAMADMLPQEVLWRKKSPYPKTFDPRYTKLVSQRLEHVLADTRAPLFHLVERGAVRALLKDEQPWPWYGQLMRSPQTIAYFLQLDFWLRAYQVDFLF
ncbi:MAG: asparagine synthase (glutamine-hydrolyzing) [Oscillospiraceae bacterium]|nr:asparagine synthase (glutamine-hydrolyzing) [Oscillospiraceae bacterium]